MCSHAPSDIDNSYRGFQMIDYGVPTAAARDLLDLLDPSIRELHTTDVSYSPELLQSIEQGKLLPRLTAFTFFKDSRFTFDTFELEKLLCQKNCGHGSLKDPRVKIVRDDNV
ncbi:hypothetical protein DXG03_006327 [Asterophora parasitica]|uniref:Uncharacterized protein n=1 Tax=Asterophora parasitica TaxID=117018 RepID=A0A9P7KDJ6_9AGAR|nr:hypothetical protein DXG03_006327 [Asterophora parasitica]